MCGDGAPVVLRSGGLEANGDAWAAAATLNSLKDKQEIYARAA